MIGKRSKYRRGSPGNRIVGGSGANFIVSASEKQQKVIKAMGVGSGGMGSSPIFKARIVNSLDSSEAFVAQMLCSPKAGFMGTEFNVPDLL